jgi:proton glutamate symport protein
VKINVPETVPAAPARRSRIPSNTTQIFIGLLLGILIGYVFPSSDANGVHTAGIGEQIKPIADTFLRMIKMIIAPLLFSTLVVGIAGTGDLKSMGRIGLKAIIYFEVATTIALFLGLLIVNVFQPGVGVQAPTLSTDSLKGVQAIQAHTGWDMLVSLIPTSVVDAMARGDILQLVVFSIFFGVGLAAVGDKGRAVTEVLESTAQVMFKVHGLRDDVSRRSASWPRSRRPWARWASAFCSRSASSWC